jgi:hypothetical protein
MQISRAICVAFAFVACASGAAQPLGAYQERIACLNRDFLAHLETLGADRAIQVSAVRMAWEVDYRDAAPESFIPDALARVYPVFGEALSLFDQGFTAESVEPFRSLMAAGDPYLAANAAYFYIRALAELGRYEELSNEAAGLSHEQIRGYTPYGDQLRFVLAAADTQNLLFDAAAKALEQQAADGVDAPELVARAARQLAVELDRVRMGTLDEVALTMRYVRTRLDVPDTSHRVRDREQQIIDLLDKLIEEAEQQEHKGGGGGGKAGGDPQPRDGQGQGPSSGQPAEDSQERNGPGRIGDLHAAPRIEPGEFWGKLPPDERERILQSIRERFPSRYRELVEQYYRSLAEEK